MIDETGKITGYKTKVGADTVFPFSSEMELIQLCHKIFQTNSATGNVSFSDTMEITLSEGKHTLICLLKNRRGTSSNYITSKNISIDGYEMKTLYNPEDYYGTLLKTIELDLNEKTAINVNFEMTSYSGSSHGETPLGFVFDYSGSLLTDNGVNLSKKVTGTLKPKTTDQTIDTGLSKINALFISNKYTTYAYINGEQIMSYTIAVPSIEGGKFTYNSPSTTSEHTFIAYGAE